MPLGGTGNHFWSIAVEEQFYLAAPIMIVLLPLGRSTGFWIIVAVAAVLSKSWYGAISMGVLAAVTRPRVNKWLLIGGATALTAAMFKADYAMFAPLVAVSVVLLSSKQGPRGVIGEFVGGMSYPLYLYHWIGIFAANAIAKYLEASTAQGMLAYALAVLVGAGAYVVVDRNVMRLRAHYYSRRIGFWAMISAYALLLTGVIGGFSKLNRFDH